MMTATVLAKKSDVSLYTVRHYTRIGILRFAASLFGDRQRASFKELKIIS